MGIAKCLYWVARGLLEVITYMLFFVAGVVVGGALS